LLKGSLLEEQPPVISDAGVLSPRGRRVYDAICRCHKAHGCVEHGLVSAEMPNGHTTEPTRLALMAIENLVIPENARHYAKQLERFVARSELVTRAAQMHEAAEKGDDQARLREHIDGMQELVEGVHEASLGPKAFSLREVMDEPDTPVPYVIQGWLAARDFVVVGGEPGTGKSVFALDLAIALSSGTEFLGSFRPDKQQTVLYLDEEMDRQLARRRIRQLVGGRQLEPEDLAMHYFNSSGLNLDRAESRLQFRVLLEQHEPDWVVLDSLIRFHSRNENDNSAMSEFFEMLKAMRVEYGCGIIALHHLSKPSKERSNELGHRLRGASDIRATIDQLWGIEGDTNTDVRQLKHEKNRWGRRSSTLTMAWDESDDRSTATLSGGSTASNAEDMLIDLLQDAGEAGMGRQGIIQVLRADYSENSAAKIATQALGKLCGQGTLMRHKRGRRMHFWHKDHSPQMTIEEEGEE